MTPSSTEVESMIMGASYNTPRVEGTVKQVFGPARDVGRVDLTQTKAEGDEKKDANSIFL